MARIRMLLLIATALLLAAPAAVLGAASDEQIILDLERKLSDASARNDIAVIRRIVGDDYIGIEAIGKIETKATWIDGIKSEAVIVEAEEPSEMKVRMYGDVAVVTGHLSIRDKRDNKVGHHEVAFTDVWVRRNGHWQLVNYQGTMMPPRPAAAR